MELSAYPKPTRKVSPATLQAVCAAMEAAFPVRASLISLLRSSISDSRDWLAAWLANAGSFDDIDRWKQDIDHLSTGEFLYLHGFRSCVSIEHVHPEKWPLSSKLTVALDDDLFTNTDLQRRVSEIIEQHDLAELTIQRLAAAIVAASPNAAHAKALRRALELDDFQVDEDHLRLINRKNLPRFVTLVEEEERLTAFVRTTEFPSEALILRHVLAARAHYEERRYQESLGQARSFIEALIDDITVATSNSAQHPTVIMPPQTANRIKQYLRPVNFFDEDEKDGILSVWHYLCQGAHPGVPLEDEARIGLILALEFGQMLVLKFGNWKKNQYRGFSP